MEIKVDGVVRGHHVYKFIWTPFIGKELVLELEERNEHNGYAVSVKKT